MFKLKLVNKPKVMKLKCNFSFPDIVLANLQEKEVIPTKEKQEIVPDHQYDGLSKVTVDAITLQDKTITPTIEEQIVFPDDNYNGLNKVTVNAVTNEIDKNIKSENIKNGVDILGVTGNYVGNKYAPKYISFNYYDGTNLDYETANLDTSNITDMHEMFKNCANLTTLDLSGFNTSKVTNMYDMFHYCRKLTNIPKLNASNVTNVNEFVNNCLALKDFGGLENLGQAYSTTASANNSSYKLVLSQSGRLTEQSLINVLNNLYDIKTKGCNPQQLVVGSTNLAKLTAEEIAIATNKGWSVS